MSGVKGRLFVAIVASVFLAGPTASAVAADPVRTITVEKTGSGSGRVYALGFSPIVDCGVTCTATLVTVEQVTLVVEPDAESVFVGWGGDCPTGSTGCVFEPSVTDQRAIAQFDRARTVAVSMTGIGSVSAVSGGIEIECSTDPEVWFGEECEDSAGDSQTVKLVASPADGYMFAGWTGACSGWACTIVPGSERADVTARFVRRALLRNRTVRFKNAFDGTNAVGGSVTWITTDGKYKSSKATAVGAGGLATFASIPGGAIQFTISNTSLSDWTATTSDIIAMDAGPTKEFLLVWPSIHEPRVHVTLPGGRPVPGAVLTGTHPKSKLFPNLCTFINNDPTWIDKWVLKNCRTTATTNEDGYASLRVIDQEYVDLNVEIADGDISYLWDDTAYSDPETTPATIEIVIDPLPYVDMVTDDADVAYAARTTFTAVAMDENGDPLAGKLLLLKSKATGASASSCRAKLRATTNAEGIATFAACPIKATTWTVDGSSIIGSDGAAVTVRTRPSAPRIPLATEAVGKIALTWIAPAEINAGRVTDYVVQYRLVGASSWTTFKDGTSANLKATVTKLTAGQAYEFRVAAKNSAGQSAWSDVVTATPR